MQLAEIKQIEFSVFDNIMTVYLKQKQNIDGINTNKVVYKCSMEIFQEKLNRLNDYNLNKL